MEINKLIAEYICLLRMEEDLWRQKATLRWLTDGDKNTRFYQSWVKQKRIWMRIHKINVDGQELSDEMEIRDSAVQFVQKLLAPDPLVLMEPDLSLINQHPPSDEMCALAKESGEEEVKRVVFGISGDSALGPDGFTASFFQTCWGFIGSDVVAAIYQFF